MEYFLKKNMRTFQCQENPSAYHRQVTKLDLMIEVISWKRLALQATMTTDISVTNLMASYKYKTCNKPT
jgi:hypothetical protein